ncbi:MAG: cobaltochelatase subunit CobN [Thermodesulfovibrio sp.]|nr:cobaltochelatase subunit CobN [Thermodesulfovibrio sp.]
MLKVLAVVWQSYYNILLRASKNIKDFAVKVYSVRVLEQNTQKLEEVFKEIEEADIIFLYRSNESVWEEIENKIKGKNIKAKIVCLGHDPSYFMLSNVEPEVIGKAYKYIVINGDKNVTNMFYFLAKELGGLNIFYEEPEEIPWQGLYHPEAGRIFTDIEEYFKWYESRRFFGSSYIKMTEMPTVGVLFSRHYWINGNTELEDLLIKEFESRGFNVISAFAYSVKDNALGTKGSGEVVVEYFIDKNGKPRIDGFIKLISFFLGTSREKRMDNTDVASDGVEILKKLNVPVFCPVNSYYKTIEEWEKEELNLDIGWSIALPEFEGVIEPVIVSAQKENDDFERRKMPIEERVKKFVERISRWIELKRTPVNERKIAFILHNNPCASVEATVGSAAHLDSLESVVEIMKRMKEVGYKVEPPKDGKALIDEIINKKAISEFRWTTVDEIVEKGGALALVDKEKYLEWFNELPEKTRARMVESWGEPPGEYKNGIPPAMVYNGKIVITGLSFGNVLVMVQPKRGCAGSRCDGQVCRILHDPDTPPPHQYVATYKWLSREFKANAIVHVGTHGNLEFLPGKGVGLSSACFPDICIDTMPHLYIYNADNPPEGTIAKRRSYAVLVDHMQTVLTESNLYDELLELDRLLGEYEEAKIKEPSKIHTLEHMIIHSIKKAKLEREIKIIWQGKRVSLSELSHEEIHQIPFEKIVQEVHAKLSLIRGSQVQDGMHIFGRVPEGERRVDFIYSIMRYDAGEDFSLRREIAKLLGYELNELFKNPQTLDISTGKTYGAILEDIDRIGKEIIKEVLKEEAI